MSYPSHIQTVDDLTGPAGKLEALLNTGRPDAPFSALVAHPNPLGGGTMHNKVVYHAMKAFAHFGLPVLRFNFRGTGLSEGVHDNGIGEQDDVKAAIDWLDAKFGRPILFAGFSFGSNVGMRAVCPDARVPAIIGLGLPVNAGGRAYHYKYMSNCSKPRLFISGDKDEYAPVDQVEQLVQQWPEPKKLVWIPGGDHFFGATEGSPGPKLDAMRQVMIDWLTETVPELTA